MTPSRRHDIDRSRTWLRNTGVGREMLRLIQSKGTPIRRIFRQLAELGVPCSMTEGLVGQTLRDWHEAKPMHEARLQALWALAEAYTDVANRTPGSVEGLSAIVDEALQLGVWYEPPSCAAVVIDRAARKVTRWVEDDEMPCRPGRSQSHDRLWAAVMAKTANDEQLTPDMAKVVELRLGLKTITEIGDTMRRATTTIQKLLTHPVVVRAIEAVKPIDELEREIAVEVARRQAASRAKAKQPAPVEEAAPPAPRARPWRPAGVKSDAWMLEELEKGVSVNALAKRLGTSRQALTYRIGQVRAALRPPTPLGKGGKAGGLPSPNFRDGAPSSHEAT